MMAATVIHVTYVVSLNSDQLKVKASLLIKLGPIVLNQLRQRHKNICVTKPF